MMRRDEGCYACQRLTAGGCGMHDAAISTCLWQLEDEDADSYRTACGHVWEFTTGGPAENGARFCPYCGARIIQEVTP